MKGHSSQGPLLVLLVFASSTLGDVKHILESSSGGNEQQQPSNSLSPHEINCLAHANTQVGTLIRGPDGNYPLQQQQQPGQPFWWAEQNSPFKHAYEYFKKCSLKGNCNPNVIPGGFEANAEIGGGFAQNAKIDVQKNPFLNGQFQGVAKINPPVVQPQMDLSKNPFFKNSKFAATSSTGQSISSEGGFLGVQPVQPFGNKKPFSTTYPGQSVNQGAQPFPISFPGSVDLGGSINANPYFKTDTSPGLSCKDAGYICVSKEACKGGVMDASAAEGLYEIGKKVS